MKLRIKKTGFLISIFLLLVTTIFVSIIPSSTNAYKISPSTRRVIHIKKGMSLHQVAQEMKSKELIQSVLRFKLLAWLRGASMKIQSGEYELQVNSSMSEILDTLVTGKIYLHKVTFPEGYNLFEMGDLLEKGGFLNRREFLDVSHNSWWIFRLLKSRIDSLEGYLFPDTYYIPRPISAKHLTHQMVQRFFSVYSKLNQESLALQLTRHQVVILASIVEKETGKGWERPLIASVFYNRLKKQMRLESDPTILYGLLKETGVMPFNIRKKDILRKTAYNTYRISGFPAGPITNPGKEALKAVLEPKSSSFLYFVSRNDGTHVFSKTYREHQKAVRYWQQKKR